MRCQGCGSENREGELICQSCGQLVSASLQTKRIRVDTDTLADNKPRIQTGSFNTLLIEIEDAVYNFPVAEGNVVHVGRGIAATGVSQVALDLMGVGGVEGGVSRQHAMISIENNTIYIMDLESTNGTFLNGQQLKPHRRHVLLGGDGVQFGALKGRVELA